VSAYFVDKKNSSQLYSINGRSTHTSKLRADFDTGADYALAETMPSDLDPHSVSSIFKAYLRECMYISSYH
jgi:hypothetical protein